MAIHSIINKRWLLATLAILVLPLAVLAQNTVEDDEFYIEDISKPSPKDTIKAETLVVIAEADSTKTKVKRDWATWKPDPKRAMWLAIVFPGAGQMYNRKYWKLPIIYGGFVGCFYAYSWNGQMYKDYAQAYMDIMDDDDTTHSYDQFMHLGNQVSGNISRYQNLFKKRKDRFRRYRDMSVFCIIGVYALSVIDAYVDASLSEFDISDDLTLRVSPTYINDKYKQGNPFRNGGWGLQCSINF